MRADCRSIVALAVLASALIGAGPALRAQGEATTWAKVMYLGGAAGVRGKSLDWNNQLTVSPQAIEFSGKNKVRFHIDPRSVRTLDYTGHKHVNDDAAGGGLLVGGLVGMLAGSAMKSTDHYLVIEYALPDGTTSAVLFRLHKDNHREIVDALRKVTGVDDGR